MEAQADYKTRKQTIFRTMKNQDNPFVMIDRRPIENPNLSWKAKGILAYLLSRPDNWIVRIGDLVKRSPDGVYAIRGAIKELEQAGHLSRKEVRDETTKQFVRYELEVYELPFTSRPVTNFPQAGKPQAENLPLNDTDCNENELTNGAEAPDIPLPLDWQIGIGKVTIQTIDEEGAKRKDVANLIAMGLGINSALGYQLAMAFMEARNITLSSDPAKVKGQRKAVKEMIAGKVSPEHVRQATQELVEKQMTVTDLYSVIKTAISVANKPETFVRPEFQRYTSSEGNYVPNPNTRR